MEDPEGQTLNFELYSKCSREPPKVCEPVSGGGGDIKHCSGREFCEYRGERRAAGTQEVMEERAGNKGPAGAMRSYRRGFPGAGAGLLEA